MPQNLTEIRDALLHTNSYKTEIEKLAYANGVLDMFCETRKDIALSSIKKPKEPCLKY